jgi:hypothetical protein
MSTNGDQEKFFQGRMFAGTIKNLGSMVLPASLSPLAVTTGLGICVRTPGAGEPASTSALLWVLAHGMRSGGRLQT